MEALGVSAIFISAKQPYLLGAIIRHCPYAQDFYSWRSLGSLSSSSEQQKAQASEWGFAHPTAIFSHDCLMLMGQWHDGKKGLLRKQEESKF